MFCLSDVMSNTDEAAMMHYLLLIRHSLISYVEAEAELSLFVICIRWSFKQHVKLKFLHMYETISSW